MRLCRLLEKTRRDAEAIVEARLGLKRFPHAHDLAEILRASFERHRVAQGAKARIAASKDPALDDLCEVVRAFLGFAKLDDAARAAAELVARFPAEPVARLLHGLTSKALFSRDHASRDGKAALESFRSAVDLDATSLEARRNLAETYALIGATSQAVFHVLLALDLDPEDAATNLLYAKLRRAPLARKSERDLLWEAEVNDQTLVEKKALPLDRDYGALLFSGVRKLSSMRSVRRVAMKHKGVALVADKDRMRPASEQSDPFLAAIERMRMGASTWAKRVNVGGFEEAMLVLRDSTVFVVAGGGSVLALELDGESQLAGVADEARNLVATWTSTEHRNLEWVR